MQKSKIAIDPLCLIMLISIFDILIFFKKSLDKRAFLFLPKMFQLLFKYDSRGIKN